MCKNHMKLISYECLKEEKSGNETNGTVWFYFILLWKVCYSILLFNEKINLFIIIYCEKVYNLYFIIKCLILFSELLILYSQINI